MSIAEKIARLREKMAEKGMDVYVIPTADFHQSEYVGGHFKARAYMTGFTGSAGTAVITASEARLWTDGRYFIQAGKQLAGSPVELMKMGEPGVPTLNEYLHPADPYWLPTENRWFQRLSSIPGICKQPVFCPHPARRG